MKEVALGIAFLFLFGVAVYAWIAFTQSYTPLSLDAAILGPIALVMGGLWLRERWLRWEGR